VIQCQLYISYWCLHEYYTNWCNWSSMQCYHPVYFRSVGNFCDYVSPFQVLTILTNYYMRRCLAVFSTSWMRESIQRSAALVCNYPLPNLATSCDISHIFALIHQEVEEILELLKSTWRILGITETVHDTCYAWVLFWHVSQ
jgi:hypothetical protein